MAMQMVVYLVCYSLQVPASEQESQVGFWLQFLNSALPMTSQLASSKWKVMMVGLRSDEAHPSSNFTKEDIGYWQQRFKRIPLYKDELFAISSKSSPGSVAHLLQAVESVCSTIFQAHCVRIPSSYRKMLEIIQSLPKEQHFSSTEDIRELVAARSAATTTPGHISLLEKPFPYTLRRDEVSCYLWHHSGVNADGVLVKENHMASGVEVLHCAKEHRLVQGVWSSGGS